MWRWAYDQYGDVYWYWDEYARQTAHAPFPVAIIVLLLFLIIVAGIFASLEENKNSAVSPTPLPTIPDYSHEIRYWENEARRTEAEMQARAKQAEQEEFDRWLRNRRNG